MFFVLRKGFPARIKVCPGLLSFILPSLPPRFNYQDKKESVCIVTVNKYSISVLCGVKCRNIEDKIEPDQKRNLLQTTTLKTNGEAKKTTMRNSVQFSVCILVLFLGYQSAHGQACTNQALSQCIAVFSSTSGLTVDNYGVPIPFGDSVNTDTLCANFETQFKPCTNFATLCALSQQNTLDGIRAAFEYICSTGKTAYLEYNPCLGSAAQVSQTSACINSLNHGLTPSNFCSKVASFVQCMTGCTGNANAYRVLIFQTLYAKQVQRYGCSSGSGAPRLSRASWTSVFGFLTLCLVSVL